MKIKNLFLICLLFFISHLTFAQVSQVWVKTYSGAGHSDDEGAKVITDKDGNIYVAGKTGNLQTDMLAIKYNSAGTQMWAKTYNGSAFQNDEATDIAVDTSGNVYVVGRAALNSGVAFTTIKYNSSGVQQWVMFYQDVSHAADYVKSVVLDNSGNIYVGGTSATDTTATDYVIIKYSSAGVAQWTVRYNDSLNKADDFSALTVDNFGNVYVTGQANFDDFEYFLTVKFNSAGQRMWAASYRGIGVNDTSPAGICVDSAANVYVTGRVSGNGSSIATVKYNSNGIMQWDATYTLGTTYCNPVGLQVDNFGNVYIGANVNGTMAALKYNNSGVQQWIKRYSNSFATAMTIDTAYNVYVTGGWTASNTFRDYCTLKFDKNGNQIWVMKYNGNYNEEDFANSVAADKSGNVYVTGFTDNGLGVGFDCTTIKYTNVTNISSEGLPPSVFSLSQNYPNPFNPNTNIEFSLPEKSFVKLKIFDFLGREVSELVNENLSEGTYRYNFNGINLASGMYFYKLETEKFSETKKMILVK